MEADWIWWGVTILLMGAGLLGTVLPLLPGSILILGGAVVNFFAIGSIGWPTLVVLTLLMVASQLLDIVSGSIGAKYFGATRWGAVGGIVGAVVGIFFGFVGLFIGPLIGALVGELLGGKGVLPAGRSGAGTFVGTTAGMLAKIGIGLLMVIWFLVAAAF